MSGKYDELLAHAKRDVDGGIVTAHLRRREEEHWDRLVVAENGQPLTFRGPPSRISDEVVFEDGSALMVLACTPSGVSPDGHLAVPADESGSPLGKIVTVVSADGESEVEPPNQEAVKPPPLGRDSFAWLLERAAMRRDDQIGLTQVEAADGGTATVVLSLDRRPLRLWFESPDSGERALMCISTHGDGLVGEVIDDALRPLHSDEALAQLLGND